MKCAEQVSNVYVRAQMWKAIYCYIISTKDTLPDDVTENSTGVEKETDVFPNYE